MIMKPVRCYYQILLWHSLQLWDWIEHCENVIARSLKDRSAS